MWPLRKATQAGGCGIRVKITCESLPCPCGAGGGNPTPRPKPTPPRRPGFSGRIVRVTDGDTVVVRSSSGTSYKTRLIGIDTPEVFGGLECGARAASASMKRLAPLGRRVRVKGDPTQDRRDAFGRLLAYVTVKDGPQLNIAQVRRGHAKVFVFEGNPFCQTGAFRRAAQGAKRAAGSLGPVRRQLPPPGLALTSAIA